MDITLGGAMEFPVICCRHCGQIRLIPMPGEEPPVDEYFTKVVLHENDCAKRPQP